VEIRTSKHIGIDSVDSTSGATSREGDVPQLGDWFALSPQNRNEYEAEKEVQDGKGQENCFVGLLDGLSLNLEDEGDDGVLSKADRDNGEASKDPAIKLELPDQFLVKHSQINLMGPESPVDSYVAEGCGDEGKDLVPSQTPKEMNKGVCRYLHMLPKPTKNPSSIV
jgi:hypothetical protein